MSLYRAWQVALAPPRENDDADAVARALAAALARVPAQVAAQDPADLAAHLARICPKTMASEAFLEAVNVEDVAFARSCSAGEAAALATFDQRFDPDLRMIYAQGRGAKPTFDEYAQAVRTRLLTGERPRIGGYAGIGELKNWVRVAASRVLVDLQRAQPGARHVAEEAALSVPAPDDDPETDYLKRLYREEMKVAFERAVDALTPAERNLLRDYYARRLTVDELAAARGVHRATAARQVANARATVLRHTRQRLMQQTHMSQDELASVVRLIESQLYVSVERVFAHEAC